MKKFLKKSIGMSLFFLAFTFGMNAQDFDNCGTMDNLERLKKIDPKLEQKIKDYEAQIQEYINNNPGLKTSSAPVIIPVVLHIVYKNATENISTALCNQIIAVLNQDFGRTNSDTTATPAPWKSLGIPSNAQFCLAVRDPSGAPHSGIERRSTTIANFTTDDKIKFFASGGLDAWDTKKYFNIWVADLAGSLGGYGEFPTGTATNTYGHVSDYTQLGTGQYVATHECGHCFNLLHIWGDDGTACTGSDLVSDTPNHAGASASCFTYPKVDACSPVAPGIMFMNYMDYGPAGCKNLFTAGQVSRINAVLAVAPYNALATSNGCTPVVLLATDAGNPSVTKPNGLVCSTSFSPVVQLRNWGTSNLTSVVINYRIDSNPVASYTWTGSVPSLTIVNVTLPNVTTTAGNHTFKVYTTLPNSTVDGNNTNDTAKTNFNVVPLGQPIPFSYGFEPVTFPPTNWTLSNPDASVTLARTTAAAKTGAASMWFNSINYTCNGCYDEITLPNLDLTPLGSPLLTFQVAYRLLTDPMASQVWSDTLRVQVSTDCGATWTQVYSKAGSALTTIIPAFSTTAFVPGLANWRLETISLAPFVSSNNALVKFQVISDYENNLYIDDININGVSSIKTENESAFINLYPNPNNGSMNLVYELKTVENALLSIYDITGKLVYNKELNEQGKLEINLKDIAAGLYYYKVETATGTLKADKLIIMK